MSDLLTAKKRFDYIDLAKAIGMLTIIWGHVAVGKSVTFVYAFHIPLFFFLSGMVFVKDKYPDFLSFVKRRIQTLIVPYIIYSFITWVIWAVFSYATHADVASYWMPLLETFIGQGSEGYLVHNVPLWFVSCLFAVELLYYWISKLSDLWNVILCLILAVSSWVLVNKCEFFDFTTLPWSLEVAMAAMLFYSGGHLLVKNIGHLKFELIVNRKKWISFVIMLVLFVLTYYGSIMNGKVSMGHANLRNPLIFYPTAYLGVMAIIILSSLIANSRLGNTKLFDDAIWFGQNSFIAMVIHNPIKGFVIVAISSIMGMEVMEAKRNVLTALLAFAITLVITIVLIYIIVRIKSRVKKDK